MLFIITFALLCLAVPLSLEISVRGRDNIVGRASEEVGEASALLVRHISRWLAGLQNRMAQTFAYAFSGVILLLMVVIFGWSVISMLGAAIRSLFKL